MPTPVSINAGGNRRQLLATRDTLIQHHLKLVPPIARSIKKKLPPSFDLDDLIGEGNIGLLHAATRYRPSAHAETPFNAYAKPRIRGAIIDSVRRRCWTDNTAFPLEAAPELGARRPMPVLIRGKQLQAPQERHAGWTTPFRLQHLPKRLAWALGRLPWRQRAILTAFYAEAESTMADIAITLHLSLVQVRAEHRSALASLHASLLQDVSKDVSTLLYFPENLERRAA